MIDMNKEILKMKETLGFIKKESEPVTLVTLEPNAAPYVFAGSSHKGSRWFDMIHDRRSRTVIVMVGLRKLDGETEAVGYEMREDAFFEGMASRFGVEIVKNYKLCAKCKTEESEGT